MNDKPIYLDFNASTPLAPEVIEAMKPILENIFGNPSSSHWYGRESRKVIETARYQVAEMIGCSPEEIIFTSGGSESNNLAIRGNAENHPGGHIITTQIEHPAILEVCHYLQSQGYEITYVPVNKFGIVNPKDIKDAIKSNTFLITIMLANNETGSIQPVEEIGKIARANNILFHTDAAQAAGKIKIDVKELDIDFLSIAGHKFYAPKGVGALYKKNGVPLSPVTFGANHESGLRPGTENVLEIVGLGAAASLFSSSADRFIDSQIKLRNLFWRLLSETVPAVQLNGHPDKRLPNTINVFFPGLDANTILSALPEIAASAGAACHADIINPSHVLTAMGFDPERALGSIRFSIGRTTTEEEIKTATTLLTKTVNELHGKFVPAEINASQNIKLTHFTHGLGCACKLRPQNLEKIIQSFIKKSGGAAPELINFDDAAIYPLNEEESLISTVDFFTPVVDDAFNFGQIAAANSLSDIYAMGAKPLFALNIAAFPEKRLPLQILENILDGASSVTKIAGISILGGHTIEDNEPKFGMAVIGIAPSKKILKNNTVKPGDALVLTKPIGTGIFTTALKQGELSQDQIKYIVNLMTTLNKDTAEIMTDFPVNACTDVTGFGLLGHLSEMLSQKTCDAIIEFEQVPLIPQVRNLMALGIIPGGTLSNFDYISSRVSWNSVLSPNDQKLLCDAQTSGGLLIAIPEKNARQLLTKLTKNGIKDASIIGKVIEGTGRLIVN